MGQLDTHIRVKLVGSSKAKPGESIFTSSGVFTVPKGVTQLQVFAVGGGCGKYPKSATYNFPGPSSGGGGGYTITSTIDVSSLNEIQVTIASGSGNSDASSTIVGPVIAKGAIANLESHNGGCGGSGGGSLEWCASFSYQWAGNGGSDGSNGYPGHGNNPAYTMQGTGQGTTTRAFGESEGTLYAGGGGGAICSRNGGTGAATAGNGGAGGGGNGCRANLNDNNTGIISYITATSGGANTGGGGGGTVIGLSVNPGGSGIAIIRWGY